MKLLRKIEIIQDISWKRIGEYVILLLIGTVVGIALTLGQINRITEAKLKENQEEYSRRKAELIELELKLLERE